MTDQELKALFEEEARVLAQDAQVPAAGQVWWRSALRARTESAHAAARPMVWLQALTCAAAVGLAVAGVAAIWPRFQELVREVVPGVSGSFVASLPLPLLLAAGVGIIAAPIAFYLAVPRD